MIGFQPTSPTEQLFFTTVRIETTEVIDGKYVSYIGTGFVLNSESGASYLVTCRHVVEPAREVKIVFRAGSSGKPILGTEIIFELAEYTSEWRYHPNAAVDIAMTPLDPLVRARTSGLPPHAVALPASMIPSASQLEELDGIEEVFFVGYPRGVWDRKNGLPIVRRGITASPPALDFDGEKKFLIDAPVFSGSSGSPVVLLDRGPHTNKYGQIRLGGGRAFLLGILAKAHFSREDTELSGGETPIPLTITRSMSNLGYVFHAVAFLETIRAHYEPETEGGSSSSVAFKG